MPLSVSEHLPIYHQSYLHIITIYLLFIGISRENRKKIFSEFVLPRPFETLFDNPASRVCKIIKKVEKGRGKKNSHFLFCFDFTMNCKYIILFHFESANIWGKNPRKKNRDHSKLYSFLYLPLTRRNRKFSGMSRDVIQGRTQEFFGQ